MQKLVRISLRYLTLLKLDLVLFSSAFHFISLDCSLHFSLTPLLHAKEVFLVLKLIFSLQRGPLTFILALLPSSSDIY